MSDATFLSQSSLFEGDYHCILHSPKNEFTSVVHYHDFYEVVIYLGNAGVFQIEGSEYLVRRGDIVLIDMFKLTPSLPIRTVTMNDSVSVLI